MQPIVGIAYRKVVPENPAKFSKKSLATLQLMLDEAIGYSVNLQKLVKNKRVLIKPNLVRPNPKVLPAITTDVRVILGFVQLLRDSGAGEIGVGENPGYKLSAREAFALAGLAQLLPKYGAKPVYLDEEPAVRKKIPDALVMNEMDLPKAVLDAEVVINLPKMKTHMHTLVTLGIKNLHGLLYDYERLLFHRNDVSMKVVDILRAVRPQLTVIDGIMAMEGQAPLSGHTIPDMNTLIAGTDPVAVDAVGCAVMGIDPEEVATNRIAAQEGLGCSDLNQIKVKGTAIHTVKRNFKRPVISSVGVFKNVTVIEGGACNGCLSALRHTLDKLHHEQKLDRMTPFTVYVGIPMPNVTNLNKWTGAIWLFGNCTVGLVTQENIRNANPNVVLGCAPHIFDLYKLLITQISKK
ncbi:MAG: DUF362 domain-containing protein [bacterium]|nr:DUF362 domain-containing protein [bacterium]